jgi:adenylate cyclase
MKGNFCAELKRRNVYKVAVAYAVISWLLIQATSILLPTFEGPPWVMKVFVVILVLGFPIALVFSWAFEITPEGIKRTEDPLFDDLRGQPRFEALAQRIRPLADRVNRS